MTERLPPESAQRQPEVRIFSGARLNKDGTFVSLAHQKLSDLWKYEMERRNLPGILRQIPTKVEDETRVSLRINPISDETKTVEEAITLLEETRSLLEKGVVKWVRDGEPKYTNLVDFRERYISSDPTKSQE